MKKSSKIMALLICIGLVGSALSGCGKNSTDTKENGPVEITYYNFGGSGDTAGAALSKMVTEFEKENTNIKVKVETVGYADYFSQLQTKLAGGDIPDCFELNKENFPSYAKQNILLELDPLMEKLKFDKSSVKQEILDAYKIDGKYLAMPVTMSSVVLIYNKDLFKKAGIPLPTDDWTYDQFDEAARKIKAYNKDFWGCVAPVGTNELLKFFIAEGGGLTSSDGSKWTINDPKNVAALQKMVNRYRVDKSDPLPDDLGGVSDWNWFEEGKIGMMITGNWAFNEFKEKCKFDWDVVVEPSGSVKRATLTFGNSILIPKKSAHPDEAFKFAAFMAGSKEAAQIRIDANWETPTSGDQSIVDAYLKITPPENKKAVYDTFKYAVSIPAIANYNEFYDMVNKLAEAARDGNKTCKEALDSAQAEAEKSFPLK